MLRAWEFNQRLFKIHGHDDAYFHGLDSHTDYNYGRFLQTYIQNQGGRDEGGQDQGSIVLDVGANIGITSIIAASLLPRSSVIAFEPGERNYQLLRKNIAANNCHTIQPFRCAIGDQDLDRIGFRENSAWGCIDSSRPPNADDPPCTTIDTFLQQHSPLGRVSALKVDVEGFELNVLTGARNLIARQSPIVYLELNTWCLTTYGDINPYRLLEFIAENFSHCYLVRLPTTGPILQSIDLATLQGRRDVIYTNMIKGRCVNDLVLSNQHLAE
jgi:FkbM family methyltransferase